MHKDPAIAFARLGYNILLEKPMALAPGMAVISAFEGVRLKPHNDASSVLKRPIVDASHLASRPAS